MKFIQHYSQAPVNLGVEMRRARLYRPEFNPHLHKILLNFIGEELSALVRLDSLNWKYISSSSLSKKSRVLNAVLRGYSPTTIHRAQSSAVV
jgi:hypothetical protein